ncbi:MAG: UbiA prenyltransferase family protein [Nanoarchaeota archaeon]|nr:UbiA prenyltransferase family protein [Nanoarchaeota archaeon]MBU1632333.1 UbiA prenyltransferase family protein [Nanoarchaeota archaeon]MBU1876206.1 UbiA prenyltransferase family protein [Nanoarchaeota archaeon]
MAGLLNHFKDHLNLVRVKQWYKNLVVFLPIFFVGHLLIGNELYLTFLGFLSLSLVSSVNYIINDIIDLKADRLHPEKKSRPLATNKISRTWAIILSFLLLIISFTLSWSLGVFFFYSVIGLFILSQLYSFFFKNIIFVDILTIAVLFVIRAVSGAYIINVKISPWLILCPFFLSLFLSIGKRHSDLNLLKENAFLTRKVLKDYNSELTSSLMTISTTLLIISYALYSFLSDHQNLIYTLPFALFVIFRYFYLINSKSIIARHPEKIIKDKNMIIGIILWILVTALSIYF